MHYFCWHYFHFWHHENISEEIFSYAATQENQTISEPNLPLASSVLDYKLLSLNKDGTWDNFIFKEGVRVLLSFFLIKNDTSGSVHSMHPLVNAWGRDRMSLDEKQKYSLIAFATLSASLKNDESQSYGFRRTLVTNVRKNIQYSNNYFDDAYEKFGWLLTEQGYSSEAEKLEIQVLNARNKTLGKAHPDTILAMENLAFTYHGLGKYTEAEKLQIQVVDIRKEILGEKHPHTILAMGNLASMYSGLGKYIEAEKLWIQVVDVRKEILGRTPTHNLSYGKSCTHICLSGKIHRSREAGDPSPECQKEISWRRTPRHKHNHGKPCSHLQCSGKLHRSRGVGNPSFAY